MHGRGSRRNSGQSFGSDGRAVNVWRTSPERLRGGTRAAFIGGWQSMEALVTRHAEELQEHWSLKSAKRYRVALPLLGRYARLHKGLDARHQLSAGRSDVTAAPSNASELVGERDGEDVVMQPLLGCFEPRFEPIALPMLWPDPDQHDPGRLDEQGTQIAVASF